MRRAAAATFAAFLAFAALAGPCAAQQPAAPPSAAVTLPAISAPSPDPKPGTFVTVKDGAATVSGGSIVGEILMWAALVLGAPLAGVLVAFVVKQLNRVGIDVGDKDRARLKEFVENGIALAAQRANAALDGKLDVSTKNEIAVATLRYVQDHGADTLKRLGYDPRDPKAVEAVQARIAKLIADKSTTVGTVNLVQQT